MSDLHAKIMNLPCDPDGAGYNPEGPRARAYKLGHKDARHAAAELASEVERQLAEAQAEIERMRPVVENMKIITEIHAKENWHETGQCACPCCVSYRGYEAKEKP